MTVLFDTQAWLWMVSAPERLSADAKAVISNADNRLLLSAASAWEIAIKQSIGKLELPQAAGDYVPSRAAAFGMVALPIEQNHALRVAVLPMHHRDPFDRLLVAQAQIEGVPILTADPVFSRYDVQVLAA